jgi:hypothetical protein
MGELALMMLLQEKLSPLPHRGLFFASNLIA